MIDNNLLQKFEQKFNENSINNIIKNAIANVGINDTSIVKEVLNKHTFEFSTETKKGEITNQKKIRKMLDVFSIKCIKSWNNGKIKC